MASPSSNCICLVSGQGEMGGGEHMLLRIGEAARVLGWTVRVVGPAWGGLEAACVQREFVYTRCPGGNRRTFAMAAAKYLSKPRLGLVWANGALPAMAAQATPNPLVVHLHQHPSPIQRLAISFAVLRARRLIVPSEVMGATISGSVVMLNWTEELAPLNREPDPQKFTIAYIGRLSVEKGVDILADAINDLARIHGTRQIRLLIAGDFRFVPSDSAARVIGALDACAAEVVRLGWADPAEVLRQADVLVVPSRWAEPFGLVAAEAMAMGCPLLVSDAGALPEVVGPEYPWVFPAGDALALSSLLSSLTGDGFTESLRGRWEDLFSPTAGTSRLGEVLGEISAEKRLPQGRAERALPGRRWRR